MIIASTKAAALLCCVASLLLIFAVVPRGEKWTFRRGLSKEEGGKVYAKPSAIIEGRVWLDENRNGIQDDGEQGVKDVLVELRAPSQRRSIDIHATETANDGSFQFVVDALDFDVVDSTGDQDFYVQVHAPDDYKFPVASLPRDDEEAAAGDEVHTSKPFQVALGESYEMNTGLVTACDASLGFLAFRGVKSASASTLGHLDIEWDPAILLPYHESDTMDCDKDEILYHVFVAQAPFDFSPYSLSELIVLSTANTDKDMVHLETDELNIEVDIGKLEHDGVLSVVVVASAGGLVSEEQVQLDVEVYEKDELQAEESKGGETTMIRMQHRGSVTRRTQETSLPLINEVLFLPNPTSASFSERRMFIEIYRPDTSYSLSGCYIENDDGSLRADFDESFDSVVLPYFTIKHKATLKREFLLWKRSGILWMRDFVLNEIGALGLFCGGKMVDFVAWGNDGKGPKGPLTVAAVNAGMWRGEIEFIEVGTPDLGGGQSPLGIQPGASLGRDAVSTDTNGVEDWSFPGGANARVPTPSSQNIDESGLALPLINEIMIRPDPKSNNYRKRRAFFEIYRPDVSFSLSGCSLINHGGSFHVAFGESFDSVLHPYITVKHKANLKKKTLLKRKKGILWIRDLSINTNVDGIALVCDGAIGDYVAFGSKGNGPSGGLHDAAVASKMWSGKDDFIELVSAPTDLGGGYEPRWYEEGDSIGRDMDSTDTNGPNDWSFPGGKNSRSASPSSRNMDHFASPLINEIMYWPRPGSQFQNKRRVFIEIFREDTSYSLSGCTLVNHDGSFRVDFDETFDSVSHPYITVERKRTLETEYKLLRRSGIFWMRDIIIEKIDAIGLFCDGELLDYVAWGNDGNFWNGTLHNNAVANGMWSSTEDYVEVAELKKGDSLGRDAYSRNTNHLLDWTFPGGSDATATTPTHRNEPTEPDDKRLRLAIENFNSFFGPALVIEATEFDGKVKNIAATSLEMMETLALVSSTGFNQNVSLVTADDLTSDSVTDQDLETMRAELESGISVGDTRILVTLYDEERDRNVTTLNTMSVGGSFFSGTLLSYTQLPPSFLASTGSKRRRLAVSRKRHIIATNLFGHSISIDTEIKTDCDKGKAKNCRITRVQGNPPILGTIEVAPTPISPGTVRNPPGNCCEGAITYAWATGFKKVKVKVDKISFEIEGWIGMSSNGNGFTIEVCCPKPKPKRGSLKGRVYDDKNDNGVKDEGESGLAGVEVVVVDADGSKVQATTNRHGEYEFELLAVGEALVGVEENTLPPGYKLTNPDPKVIDIPGGGPARKDFDAHKPKTITSEFDPEDMLSFELVSINATLTRDEGPQDVQVNGLVELVAGPEDLQGKRSLRIKRLSAGTSSAAAKGNETGGVSFVARPSSDGVDGFWNTSTNEFDLKLLFDVSYWLLTELSEEPPQREDDVVEAPSESWIGSLSGHAVLDGPDLVLSFDLEAAIQGGLLAAGLSSLSAQETVPVSVNGNEQPNCPKEKQCDWKIICIQPVFIGKDSNDATATGSSFKTMQKAADDIFKKCCVQFDWKTPKYLNKNQYKDIGGIPEEEKLIKEVDEKGKNDCIEAFFVETMTGPRGAAHANGDGVCWYKETKQAKVIVADAAVTDCNPPSKNVLAHELGHAVGDLPHTDNTKTIMQPTGDPPNCPGLNPDKITEKQCKDLNHPDLKVKKPKEKCCKTWDVVTPSTTTSTTTTSTTSASETSTSDPTMPTSETSTSDPMMSMDSSEASTSDPATTTSTTSASETSTSDPTTPTSETSTSDPMMSMNTSEASTSDPTTTTSTTSASEPSTSDPTTPTSETSTSEDCFSFDVNDIIVEIADFQVEVVRYNLHVEVECTDAATPSVKRATSAMSNVRGGSGWSKTADPIKISPARDMVESNPKYELSRGGTVVLTRMWERDLSFKCVGGIASIGGKGLGNIDEMGDPNVGLEYAYFWDKP